MVYSHNQATAGQCHTASGFTSGSFGMTEGFTYLTSLQFSDVASTVPTGTYFARFHVTFPDSSVGEVSAATVARF